MDTNKLNELRKFATQIRIETVKEIGIRGFGHLGGSLSITDLLAVLYGGAMNIDPKNPQWEDRDKLVMSKGHAGPAVYAALALKGFFPMDWLATLNQPGTHLPSHCDKKLTPGIDMTTGSLGQGVSTAIGLALAQKLNGQSSRTYLVIGDGESQEGQVWEGAEFAPFHKLDNLTLFVDYNHKQLDGRTDEVLSVLDLAAKFKSFGWNAVQIAGNDILAINDAIEQAHMVKDKPTCIVLDTVKGAGVPSVEDIELNHHIVVDKDFADNAVAHLKENLAKLEGAAK